MKTITLTNKLNKTVFVDNEDYPVLSKISWCENEKGYAIGWISGKIVRMHRLIMNCGKGLQVDHINLNKLDNRKQNLRLVSNSQNSYNRAKRQNSVSIYKGVMLHKKTKKMGSGD